MLIVYIAHPIGGDVEANMEKVQKIADEMFGSRPELYPIAPYLYALKHLDDNKPDDRLRGVSINKLYFDKKFIDEIWLFGNRVSRGMREEVRWARRLGIPVTATNSKVALSLIRKEFKPGDQMRILGCGPSMWGTVQYLCPFRDSRGIYVRNEHHRLLDLWWGDIIEFCPMNGAIPYAYRSAA